MKDKIVKKIFDNYKKKRDIANQNAENKKLKIYSDIPRLGQINDEISSESIKISKLLINNGNNVEIEVKAIKDKINKLKIEKEQILKDNNLSESDFLPVYQCMLCKDTGYLSNSERCPCYKQQLAEELFNMSNIKYRLQKENFEKFDINVFDDKKTKTDDISPRQNMHRILEACLNFCENFDGDIPSLLFYGTTGVGKTYMCNCIAAELIKNGRTVVYQTSSKLMEIVEEYKFNKTDDYARSKENYQYLYDCDLLIIDDLGTEFNNGFTNSELFNLINGRMIADKKMVISTNLSLKDLSDIYSERISSRIFNVFAPFRFYGKDLRLSINL